jgi:hypothetical protein
MHELIEVFGVGRVLIMGAILAVSLVVSGVLTWKASVKLGEFQGFMPSVKYSKKLRKEMNGDAHV